MINIDDFDKIKKRYKDYWNMENHDRPLMYVSAPKGNLHPHTYNGSLRERWNDITYIIQREREIFNNTYFAGEAYPNTFPNLGPDVFGAYFGCGLEFGEDTSWAADHFESLDDIGEIKVDWTNKWLQKTIEMTLAMLEDAAGDYLVGITDIHPGMDGLVSLRGPEELCFDIYEEPDRVKQLNRQMYDCFCMIYTKLDSMLSEKQQGSTNWMGIYHPDGWYVTSCDFMGMISSGMYDEFVDEEIRKEAQFLKNTIFHLDGPGALRHLDNLLEIPEINGIQWVYGAGQPTAQYWLDVLRKIQKAGKMIHIDIVIEDLPVLLENLKPEGVLYRLECKNEEEADYAIKLADNSYHSNLY